MNGEQDICSSDNESEYDFISSPDWTPPSSPRGGAGSPALTSSPPPPKGWSTLNLSDDAPPGSTGRTTTRDFSSSVSAATTATTTAVTAAQKATATSKEGPFHCKACSSLLRDCVECPSCHSLFCRYHLRVDGNAESPCPCEPCFTAGATAVNKDTTTDQTPSSTQNLYRSDRFLPNIPVQRMADALPSRCDACSASLSWGDLAAHACDLQQVTCEYARWGCPWTGRRQHRADHMTSSTCPGQLARAEHDITEARAETAAVRAELATMTEAKELAERRAVMAEMRGQELEDKLAAEKNLRSKEAAAAAAAVLAAATRATPAPPAAKSKKRAAAGGNGSTSSSTGGSGGDTASVTSAGGALYPPQLQPRNQPVAGDRQTSTSSTSSRSNPASAIGAIFKSAGRPTAGLSRPTAGVSSSTAASPAKQQPIMRYVLPTTAQAPATRGNRTVSFGDSPQPSAAEAAEAAEAAAAAEAVDAACQAPLPATEACLRPYLLQPNSLLKKKVVVFWPRQGRWYVGRPTVYKSATKEHRVEYDDGDVRDHVLAHRSWGLIG